MVAKMPERWTPAETAQYFRERVAAYEGDSYLVDDLVESGLADEEAQAQVGDPEVIKAYLEFDGLLNILADRTASKALKKAILAGRADVIDTLVTATQKLKVPSKRGPKAKMVHGKYLFERIFELKNEGSSYGQIAMAVYGKRSPDKISLVKVQYAQAKKRLAAARK